VLLNLVGNAIKFTQQGQVTVTAEMQWKNDDEMALHFAVRDTGIGIEPDKLDEIFQAFRQSDASTTRQYGGSGLGLTISSELVRMMGGHIWVDSTEGQGSIFHFTIQVRRGAPLALPSATPNDADAVTMEDDRDDWQSAPRVRPLQVLLADDHAANRQLVTSVLQARGHRCTEVTDGQQVLEAWRRGTYDLLLMDIQMPVMDGFQATAVIRKEEEGTGKHIPIIALTAHAMAGDRERCLAAGMDAYLAKPLRPHELIALVESVADLKPHAPPSSPPAEPTAEPSDFDLKYALESLDNDVDLLLGQMGFYLQDAPQLLESIGQSIETNDPQQLQLSAHRLKGMLARYACHAGADIALALENKGRSGQLSNAAALWQELRPIVSRLTAAIQQYVSDRQ
jgi:CheY-like chemotaxis protein